MTTDAPPRPAAAPAPTPVESRIRGILLMCVAVVCFACTDATAKWSNQYVDPLLTTWARYTGSLVIVAVVMNPWRVPGLMRTRRPLLQALRSIALLVSTVCNFIAVAHLQLTQTISIQFASPFLIALLAGPLLGEWAGRRRFAVIVVGFCGVLVVARPGYGGLHPAAFLSLGGAIAYSFYVILTRVLASHDRSSTTLFYSNVAGVVLVTPILPFVWSSPPNPLVWVLLAGIGIVASLGHWFLIVAHSYAPAPVLSPFIYTQILSMGVLGYLVFGDVPDAWTLAGAAIVIASGLYLLLWEKRRRRPVAA